MPFGGVGDAAHRGPATTYGQARRAGGLHRGRRRVPATLPQESPHVARVSRRDVLVGGGLPGVRPSRRHRVRGARCAHGRHERRRPLATSGRHRLTRSHDHADGSRRRRDAPALPRGRRAGISRETGAQRRPAGRRPDGALLGVMLGVPFCPAVAAGRDTWRRHVAQSAVVRYAVAVVAVAVMVVLGLWLRPIVLAAGQLLLLAVLVTGWLGGLRPALLAWGLATVAFAYYFTLPLDSVKVDPGQLPRLMIFALVAGFMATTSAARRRAEDALRSARDELET